MIQISTLKLIRRDIICRYICVTWCTTFKPLSIPKKRMGWKVYKAGKQSQIDFCLTTQLGRWKVTDFRIPDIKTGISLIIYQFTFQFRYQELDELHTNMNIPITDDTITEAEIESAANKTKKGGVWLFIISSSTFYWNSLYHAFLELMFLCIIPCLTSFTDVVIPKKCNRRW